jgi:hypothetical protein
VIRTRALGVCHFGSFYEAMDAAQHLVKLKPIAVELVDSTMIALGRDIAMFRPTVDAVVRGNPDALLLVEFAEDEGENRRRLAQLSELMGDLGFGWDREPRPVGRRRRGGRAGAAVGHRGVPGGGLERDDVDEGGGQARVLRRGLRRAAAAPCRTTRRG